MDELRVECPTCKSIVDRDDIETCVCGKTICVECSIGCSCTAPLCEDCVYECDCGEIICEGCMYDEGVCGICDEGGE